MGVEIPKSNFNIIAKGLTKTFGQELIVRDFNYSFTNKNKYAITGANGSGKSTLLKLISGISLPNKGKIEYFRNSKIIPSEKHFEHITFCSPSQELIEEFTLNEMIDFHLKFRSLVPDLDKSKFLDLTYLTAHTQKQIALFSSGMKQRLKLGLALFTQSNVTILDEPTTNMDERGIHWYLENIQKLQNDRLLIIASNQKEEYEFCDTLLQMENFK